MLGHPCALLSSVTSGPWRGFVYAHVRYGALAWDDYELLWDSISEDKAKAERTSQGILPGRFTPEHPLK